MKVIDKIYIGRLRSMISEAGCITLSGHTHPDGDSIGSCIGMLHYLRSLGKDAATVFPNEINSSLQFMLKDLENDEVLVFSKEQEKVRRRMEGSDLLICLDFNSFKRTDEMEALLAGAKCRKVLIDHHLNPDTEHFDLCFSETEVSSTCEYLFHILMKMPEIGGDAGKLPKECATALMTGMTTDTNNFANSVYDTTLDMAAALLGAGVDRNGIISNLYNEYRENRLRAMGYLLYRNLEITPEGVAYMIMTKDIIEEFDLEDGETEGFVNIPLSIGKVRMSIFLKEDGDHYRVSIRSKKGLSANLLAMRRFNGGGHELAAGGKLYFPKDIPTKEDAGKYIRKVTADFLK